MAIEKEKLGKITLVVLIAATALALATNQALAEGGNSQGVFGWAFSKIFGSAIDQTAAAILDGVLVMAEMYRNAIFAGPVILVSIMFDYAIWLNVKMNILNAQAIKDGWGVMQGVANMFFILVLLWIALSTIFDFEQYSAKKLLPTLIVMALLINFSLVIAATFVDFTNGLGLIFYNQMNRNNRPMWAQIIDSLSVTRVTSINNESPSGQTADQKSAQISESFDIFGNIDPKKQPLPDNVKRAADVSKKKLASDFYSVEASPTAASLARMVSLIITTLLGIILLVVLLFGIGFLIVRSVTIAFLGVFAPLAFLANIVPQTKQHWNHWWEKLTQQAFFAPAYLFCLYVTFSFLDIARLKLNPENNMAEARTFDVGFLFLYLMAIVMMIASLIVAQKMGIAMGSTAVGLAKKTGGAIKGALKQQATKMAQGAAEKFLGTGAAAAMARMPLVRQVPLAATKIQEAEEKRAKERAQLYARLPAESIARDFGKYTPTEQKALSASLNEKQKENVINTMLKEGSFESLTNENQKNLLAGVKTFIPEAELAARGVKTADSNYTQLMRDLLVEKSRDLGNVRLESLDNPIVRNALKRAGTPRDWEVLASTTRGARKMLEVWREDEEKAKKEGKTLSEIIQRDYGNNDLAVFAASSPLFKGVVVRPEWKKPRKPRRRGGGTPPTTGPTGPSGPTTGGAPPAGGTPPITGGPAPTTAPVIPTAPPATQIPMQKPRLRVGPTGTTGITKLSDDNRFKEIFKETALEILKKSAPTSPSISRDFGREPKLAPSGYLLKSDGTESNVKPEQALGDKDFNLAAIEAERKFEIQYPDAYREYKTAV